MYRLLAALATAAFVVGQAAASEKTDVMGVIHQWIDALNKGDMQSYVALCAEPTTIMDDFPPHEWQGPGACSKWFSDYQAFTRTDDATDGFVALGKPLRISITGDRAYVVTRDSFTFKVKGKPMKQSGAIHTFVLQNSGSGWRITGESWASTSSPVPVQ